MGVDFLARLRIAIAIKKTDEAIEKLEELWETNDDFADFEILNTDSNEEIWLNYHPVRDFPTPEIQTLDKTYLTVIDPQDISDYINENYEKLYKAQEILQRHGFTEGRMEFSLQTSIG